MIYPRKNHIRFGRGSGSNNHPGNKHYVKVIRKLRPQYFLCPSNAEKKRFLKKVFSDLRREDRLFVKQDRQTGLWFEVDFALAREKIRNALCGRNASEQRRMSKAKLGKKDQEQPIAVDDLDLNSFFAGLDLQGMTEADVFDLFLAQFPP